MDGFDRRAGAPRESVAAASILHDVVERVSALTKKPSLEDDITKQVERHTLVGDVLENQARIGEGRGAAPAIKHSALRVLTVVQ